MSVSTGIIELFLRPPIGLMRLEQIAGGPFSGAGNFDRPRFVVPIGNVGTDAFGLRWVLSDVPDGYGSAVVANQVVYDRTMLTLSVTHILTDQAELPTAEFESSSTFGHILFSESYPRRVFWQLAPGVTSNFWWMVRPLAA